MAKCLVYKMINVYSLKSILTLKEQNVWGNTSFSGMYVNRMWIKTDVKEEQVMRVSKKFPILNDKDRSNSLGFSKSDNEVKMNFVCTTLFLLSSLSA